MRFDVISLIPAMYEALRGQGVTGRALQRNRFIDIVAELLRKGQEVTAAREIEQLVSQRCCRSKPLTWILGQPPHHDAL